jgi:hypothetical protein
VNEALLLLAALAALVRFTDGEPGRPGLDAGAGSEE